MTTQRANADFVTCESKSLPRPFLLRRLHSIMGLWLALFLFEHLLVNAGAALFFIDQGSYFIRMVNHIHSLPYLPIIEGIVLAIPFAIHAIWGVLYALSGKLNSIQTDGSKPNLSQYKRNRAYSWQRITSWILLLGIVGHVAQMRFIEKPREIIVGGKSYFVTTFSDNRQVKILASKLHVKLYLAGESKDWIHPKKTLKPDQVLAVSESAGASFFLLVLDTFRSPWMVVLYSIFVVAGAYHGFNGLWTFMVSWGITLTKRSQNIAHRFTTLLMTLVLIMGLAAVWGAYWTMVFL